MTHPPRLSSEGLLFEDSWAASAIVMSLSICHGADHLYNPQNICGIHTKFISHMLSHFINPLDWEQRDPMLQTNFLDSMNVHFTQLAPILHPVPIFKWGWMKIGIVWKYWFILTL